MYAYQHELDEQVHRARAIALSNPTSEHLAAYGLAITDRWVGTSVLRRGTAYWHAAALHPHACAPQTQGV
jgi:hypothetical protein